MKHRTYKIDVRVVEIRTITVTVDKVRGRDDLLEAYEKALAAYVAGDRGELHCGEHSTVDGSHDLVSEVEDPTIEFKLLAPSGTGYGWLITRDYMADGDEGDPLEVGTTGPSRYSMTAAQIEEFGQEFKLVDDDGNDVYHGKFALAPDCPGASGFEPLDDFGMPNAGCTEIHYRDTAGEWRRL
jgi:hypothetical protein